MYMYEVPQTGDGVQEKLWLMCGLVVCMWGVSIVALPE